jgi:hypothetical protein
VILLSRKPLRHSPSPSAARRGTRHTQMGSWAHSSVSSVRTDSDEGRLPVISFKYKLLRHSPSPSAARRGAQHSKRGPGRHMAHAQGSCAHSSASRVSADSDEGRLPVILFKYKLLRHSPSPSAARRRHMDRANVCRVLEQ